MNSKLHHIKKSRLRKNSKVKKTKSRKIFVSPLIIGIIGSSNCIVTSLNGYTKRRDIAGRIHFVPRLTNFSLNM